MIGKRRSEKSGKRFEIAMRGCLRSIVPASRKAGQAQRRGPATATADGDYEFKIMNYRKLLRAAAWALLAIAFVVLLGGINPPLQAQTTTTVSDTIHGPDPAQAGPSGQIVISSKSTFTASDGTVVFAGVVAKAAVANGSFSVALVPNAGSTPSGASYSAIYKLAGVPYKEETWVVPSSAAPVDLSTVRSAALSGPSEVLSASQLPAVINASAILDKGGQVFNVKAYGAVGNGVADDTAAVNLAFAAAYAAGGGVVYFPWGTYLIAGALTIPNDGAAEPQQPPYVMEGAGMQVNGKWTTPASNGSVLILTETTNTVGKIDTRGSGYMEIEGLSFKDTASDSVPFIHTTNTTLHVHDSSFTSSQTGTANVQDAIVLGGTNPALIHTGNSDAPFQGYGTVIRDNFFAQVRHAVVGNTYANGVQVVNNTVGSGSGSSTSGDAPFVFIGYGSGSQGTTGGYISGNLIEATNYYYSVRLDQYAEDFTMLGNSAYDQGPNTVATYYLGTGSDTEVLSCGQVASPYCVDPAAPGATQNRYVSFSQLADSNGSGVMLGNYPTLIKGALVPAGQCFSFSNSSNMCMYLSGTSLFIRPQNNSSIKTGWDSLGNMGVKSSGPPYHAALEVNGDIRTVPVALGSAPACSSSSEGSTQAITDSTTATWGATIAGGGTNHVLGYCDGTNWTVAGK
jgi:Pectate lyase superfamily protein